MITNLWLISYGIHFLFNKKFKKSTSHHKLHRRSNKVRIHTFNKKILSRMGSGAGDDRKDIRKVLFFHNLEAINFYSLGFGDLS